MVPPPSNPAPLRPAADCSKSDVPLEPASAMDGVRLDASTDATQTSLLLKNTGLLSVVVIPDESWTTRLMVARHGNPTDPASVAALAAVIGSGSLSAVSALPTGFPASQAVIVPPGWAVCALSDDVREPASVRYLRDKASSAEYFVVKGLADQLVSRTRTSGATLLECAKSTLQLLKERPDLGDIQLYAEVLGAESDCRASYKALLSNDERAAQRTSTTVLNLLERTPQLLETTRLFAALARG
ncbi:hypothetical protein ACIBG5_20775 [Kribbella sp. NPDC050241]|uniref:hypothetical protein n=1 Tax=Kribbella sp. NPDC050241 TaxID=3364115 RepID=UPI00378FE077